MEELKARSIRANEETYEKFKSIASTEFENQGHCLSSLINLYELEQGKTTIVDRKMEIENFQSHMNSLTKMFIQSLELNQDAELRVRNEFEERLASKDTIINDIQNKTANITDSCNTTKKQLASANNEIANLQSKLLLLEKEVTEKERLITILDSNLKQNTNTIANLVKDKEQYTGELANLQEIAKERDTFKSKYDEAAAEIIKLNSDQKVEIVSMTEKYNYQIQQTNEQASMALEKALLEKEKLYQKEFGEAQANFFAQLNEYMNKNNELQSEIAQQSAKYNNLLATLNK